MPNWLNWKLVLAIIAIGIVSATVFYSQYLGKKIALQEQKNVEVWAEAEKTLLTSADTASINLATKIAAENASIPIIETNEKDSITGVYVNLDSLEIKANPSYLKNKLQEFKQYASPIVLVISENPKIENKYYYGKSLLAKQVAYYPIVQIVIVALFVLITLLMLQSNFKSSQNQVWAGLAKETAHQLGTPVSSLEGWIEMLKETPGNEKIVPEIEKDVNRLLLITDRFGKIGSKPNLETKNVVIQIQQMVEYIKKRAGQNVQFSILVENNLSEVLCAISPPLFDWVIENLLKNALDAMEGKGTIIITIGQINTTTFIEIKDSGKGISKQNVSKVFKAGFTTKKRGWGLGLTLTKRIIEQYHKGKIVVKQSEVGKGTTFRIEL